MRHGHVPGRDFHLRLTATATALRVEVADTRTERLPATEDLTTPPADAESGRGLYLVSQLAHHWGVAPRAGAPGKQMWAELRLPPAH